KSLSSAASPRTLPRVPHRPRQLRAVKLTALPSLTYTFRNVGNERRRAVSYQFVPLPKAAKSPWINQRATVRYQCAPATAGRVACAEDCEFQRAWVLDLSSKGIGLELARALPIGTLIIVQLKGLES